MAYVPEGESQSRRRSKGIPFFNDGQHDIEEKVKEGAVKAKGYLWYTLSLLRLAFTAFAVIFLALASIGLALRTVGFACKHSPIVLPFCSRPSIALQEPLVNRLPVETTPITKTLQGFEKLSNLSTSLNITGLAIHLVSQNLSATIEDFKQYSGVYQIPKDDLEQLNTAATSALGNVYRFQDADYGYRHGDVLWARASIDSLGKNTDKNLGIFNTSSLTGLAFSEHLHRIPFGLTLTSQCMHDYYDFVAHHERSIKQLVNITGETTLVLGNFLSTLGSLERRLADVVSERKEFCASEHGQDDKLCSKDPAPALENVGHMRAYVQWVQDAIKLAETEYKSLLSEVQTAADTLEAEVNSYSALIPSKAAPALRKLEAVVNLERSQLNAFIANQARVEALVAEHEKKLMPESGTGETELAMKWEAAVQERKVIDWWL